MGAPAVATRDLALVIEAELARDERLSVAELARRSGLTERKLSGIIRRPAPEYPTTSISVADRILCALDRSELLMSGALAQVEDGRGRANRMRAQQRRGEPAAA
jgi:hypothetical protein